MPVVLRDGDVLVLILRLPLGLLLAEGVALQVDGTELGRLAVQTCEADGCVAPARLDAALGSALRRGGTLAMEVTTRDGEVQRSTMSLRGVTAAMEALPP